MVRIALAIHFVGGLVAGLVGGLALGVSCAKSDMCEGRGGRWYDSVVDERLPGSCVMPSVDVGGPCTEPEHCHAGYCACSDPKAKDGAHMTGECPEFPATKADGWVCTVSNGVKHEQGLQVE